MTAVELLPAVRDLYNSRPETRGLEAYHKAWILFALGHTDALADEWEVAAASEVAMQDYPERWRAA